VTVKFHWVLTLYSPTLAHTYVPQTNFLVTPLTGTEKNRRKWMRRLGGNANGRNRRHAVYCTGPRDVSHIIPSLNLYWENAKKHDRKFYTTVELWSGRSQNLGWGYKMLLNIGDYWKLTFSGPVLRSCVNFGVLYSAFNFVHVSFVVADVSRNNYIQGGPKK